MAPPIKDLTGQRFSRLVVLERVMRTTRRTEWKCICDCGETTIAKGGHLQQGDVQSCGCLRTAPVEIGQRFGRLVVLKNLLKLSAGSRVFLCACDCGNLCESACNKLRAGEKKSCGCLAGSQNRSHGHTAGKVRKGVSPTYSSWMSMLQRALNHNGDHPTYTDVDVCPRWRESFENFLADMGERPEETTLGRFDDVGNYEPGNCAWQTRREQNETKILKRADLAMAA